MGLQQKHCCSLSHNLKLFSYHLQYQQIFLLFSVQTLLCSILFDPGLNCFCFTATFLAESILPSPCQLLHYLLEPCCSTREGPVFSKTELWVSPTPRPMVFLTNNTHFFFHIYRCFTKKELWSQQSYPLMDVAETK